MTPKEFSKIVAAAQAGQPQAFNRFYKKLYKECKASLLRLVPTETEAEDAFSEVMYKFWNKFIVEGDPLPQSNVEGYIFTMAKFYCINHQKASKKHNISTEDKLDFEKQLNSIEHKTKADFWQEQLQEDNYQTALKSGIKKLCKSCQDLFIYMLKTGKDKPRDMWQALGYKNVGTMRSKKSQCSKKLKIKVSVELDLLNQLKPNNYVHYN